MSVELKADPQSASDTRNIALHTVGIDRVFYPAEISGWDGESGESQSTQAEFSLSVSLAADKRGIHMSRLIELLHSWEHGFSPAATIDFCEAMRAGQGAEEARVSLQFMWFTSAPAPVTEKPALQGIQTEWQVDSRDDGFIVGYRLRIPVTTLCPCSRDISDYGAHSQRSWVDVSAHWGSAEEVVAPSELYHLLKDSASAPVFPLLKREDERHVTMQAYDNPSFVEDATRSVFDRISSDGRFGMFRLQVRNEESIHAHDAFAEIHS